MYETHEGVRLAKARELEALVPERAEHYVEYRTIEGEGAPIACVTEYREGTRNARGGAAIAPGLCVVWQNEPRRRPDGTMAEATGTFVEDLLLVVMDRVSAYQEGDFATGENDDALRRLREAHAELVARREDRRARGVEGLDAA